MICFRDRVVALAGERVVLAPSIAVLEEDYPELRFVAALCLYYGAVCGRGRGERYAPDRAEAFARDILMPRCPSWGRGDVVSFAVLIARPRRAARTSCSC